MNANAQRRGAPLVTLGLILVLWALVRATMWQQAGGQGEVPFADAGTAPGSDRRIGTLAGGGHGGWRAAERRDGAAAAPDVELPSATGARGTVEVDRVRFAPPPPNLLPPLAEKALRVRQAAGHQLLWLAALSRMPLPPALQALAPLSTPSPNISQAIRPAPGPRRWSGDAWLLWRRDGAAGLATGAGPASYGASQVGAVIRYRLDPASARRPTGYLRATSALERGSDRELAAGLAARPLPGIPLVANAELRVSERGTARPAAFVVTELAPAELPLGLRAEAYAQAGYVGGRDATAFVDGQLRLDRKVARLGPAELRLGLGAWGGAQDGAARLDIGPGATLGVPGAARLAFDWRFRVAGQAAPASGPALTLSAGF